MIDRPDVYRAANRILRVTAQTEIRIGVDQHFPVYGSMRVVANRAAFPQCLVLEHDRPRLLLMTLRTALVKPRHRQASRGFENVAAMRVMTLHAVHMAFLDRVMLR